MQDRIRAWVEAQPNWPHLTRSIAMKHLNEGLIDRGVTRDLAWGVPVTRHGFPRPGFEDKVFYVWFDAPIEYIAATVEWADAGPAEEARDWRRWWRLDAGADDVRYVQVMGKDNVAFHTVTFPSAVLGSDEPWKTVDYLKSFNWLNWYGEQFSTSQKRGVFMDSALELQPADVWRWWLCANAPEGSDVEFTWEQFQAVVNKDLADVLGNFVNRIVKFAETRFEGRVPEGGDPGALEAQLQARIGERLRDLTEQMEALEVRRSAQTLRGLWVIGNEYLQEAAPWTAIKTDPTRAAVVVRTALGLVRLFAAISAPMLPFTAAKMAAAVGETGPLAWPGEDVGAELAKLAPGTPVSAPEVLFRKIEDEQVAEWRVRFGGAGEG
jgi:methionyl-tRNA synthetase